MKYKDLSDFIQNRMRMSHIYQPVMLLTLLSNRGRCHELEIAKAISEHDQSQVEYYQKITNNMVGRILRKHGIVTRDKHEYSLIDFESFSKAEIGQLKKLCATKLEQYVKKRGQKIWSNRTKSSGYVSGTTRYEVLKRAKFHCELCGIPAEERALEVDHIVPRNQGGIDDITNYQALCYKCNSMKRDRDSVDFRMVKDSFRLRSDDCLFCTMDKSRIIQEDDLMYAIRDGFPVTPLHTLVIPKRHVASYFELGQAEINAYSRMLNDLKVQIQKEDSKVVGFNVGINDGETAGQTIFHCHIHLIPRRKGDVSNPRGGVRHTIPGKGNY